ncbi:hypothetical protein F5050DRAFT_1713442 [Lentinula boryana]|uniref:Uncharacterized protein n=1 Tax=Lentinula boryana TaxID=40481 RepID=A0ABQ8Q8A7_9AGAR|nr:hypothetical protein F5050DRAFT_1713442 [Lentinula boryana]
MYCVPLLQKLFIAYILVSCLGTVIASPLLIDRSPRTSSSGKGHLAVLSPAKRPYVKTTGFIVSPQSGSQLGYTLTLEFTDKMVAFTRKDSQTIVQAQLPEERYKEIIDLRVGWLFPLAADLNTLPKDKTGSDWIIEAVDYLMRSGGSGNRLARGSKVWMEEVIKTQVEKVKVEVTQSQKAEVDKLVPAIQSTKSRCYLLLPMVPDVVSSIATEDGGTFVLKWKKLAKKLSRSDYRRQELKKQNGNAQLRVSINITMVKYPVTENWAPRDNWTRLDPTDPIPNGGSSLPDYISERERYTYSCSIYG